MLKKMLLLLITVLLLSGFSVSADPSYLSIYSDAIADARARHLEYLNGGYYDWIAYSMCDINGDGFKELIVMQVLGKHSCYFWVYGYNGESAVYLGQFENEADLDSVWGYKTGILYRESYKGGLFLSFAELDSGGFTVHELYRGSYPRNEAPTPIAELTAYYDPGRIVDHAPDFVDLDDTSLLSGTAPAAYDLFTGEALPGSAGIVEAGTTEAGTAEAGNTDDREFIPWEEAGVQDHVIAFHDRGAEIKVLSLLGKDGGNVWLSELWDMTDLSLSPVDENNKIRDISFVSELRNLKELILNNNDISDLTPVASLRHLEGLFFNGNSVRSLEPIRGMNWVARIDMSNNPIEDFSPLAGMTGLTVIHSFNNNITDDRLPAYISYVASLPNLDKLDIGSNPFTNYSPIAEAAQIHQFSMWHSDLDDNRFAALVKVLTAIPNLETVSVSHNKITDVSCLASLAHLKKLIIKDNPVSSFSPLSGRGIEIDSDAPVGNGGAE